jgi:hypothetical protein
MQPEGRAQRGVHAQGAGRQDAPEADRTVMHAPNSNACIVSERNSDIKPCALFYL